MGRHAVFVLGPAGSGKSTFCLSLHHYLKTVQRQHTLINLDPASDASYPVEDAASQVADASNPLAGTALEEEMRIPDLPLVDIRELITVQDAMEECELGPNGGLMFCMEYLLENFDWLESALGYTSLRFEKEEGEHSDEDGEDVESDDGYYASETGMGLDDDEFLIVDMPGQLELFTHSNIITRLVELFKSRLWVHNFCAVYLLDATFILTGGASLQEPERPMGSAPRMEKFMGGIVSAISCMLRLSMPHVNVLSKMDLIEGRPGEVLNKRRQNQTSSSAGAVLPGIEAADQLDPSAPKSGYANTWTDDELLERDRRRDLVQLDQFIRPDIRTLTYNPQALNKKGEFKSKWGRLNEALVHLIEDYDMISLVPLNIHDEESLQELVYQIDTSLQYDEDVEPKEPKALAEDQDLW